MRHEQLKDKDSFDIRDLAAIWPQAGGASAPLGEVEAAFARTPALPEAPPSAGRGGRAGL